MLGRCIVVISSLLLIMIVGGSTSIYGQTASPITYFGLGTIQPTTFSRQNGMGDIGYGMQNDKSINLKNPASHHALNWTAFEFGIRAKTNTINSNGLEQQQYNASPGYLALGFPVTDRWGSSFGIMPFNKVAYRVVKKEPFNNGDSLTHAYQGKGDLYRLHFSNGYRLWPFNPKDSSKNELSIGVSAYYIFGHINHQENIEYPSNSTHFSIRKNSRLSVNDFLFDVGLQYTRKFKDFQLTAGVMATLQQKLWAQENKMIEVYELQENSRGTVTPNVKDTLQSDTLQGRMNYPTQIGIGVGLKKKENWYIGLDITHEKWSSFNLFGRPNNLSDNLRMTVGGELTPNPRAINNYLNRINYRLGGFYETGHLSINEHKLSHFGINFGLGLPVKKVLSTINIGVEIGRKGGLTNNNISESYFITTLGFTFNDKWFQKSKID